MENKKFLSFEVDNKNYKIHNILNQDFLELELWMIADHCPNNNMSHFTLEAMKEALPSIRNKPILAAYYELPNEELGDFMGHESIYKEDEETETGYFDNSEPYQEVPIGLITESSKIEIVKGEDGANWIKATGYLWVKYCTKQVLTLLRKKKGHTKISVEVEVLESKEDEEIGIEHINKFNFLAVTCLGSYPVRNAELLGINARQEIHEGIEGANAKVANFSKNPKFQNQLKQLTFACKQLEESMNFKNSTDAQNENKTAKVDNSVPKEGSDIYHPIPQGVENEEVSEIGYSEDEDTNDNNIDSETEKSTNARKEEKSQMNFSLSYNTRRELLDSALHEAVHGMYAGDNIWCYVNDFDDSVCYFYLEVEGADCGDWCAPYTLTLGSENGEDKVIDCNIDLSQKERVVREWKKLSEDEGSETEGKTDMKDNKNFTEEEKQTEAQNFADDRGTEAPKSGDDRAVPAPKGGDDRGDPHSPATYENSEENKDDTNKETETEKCEKCGENPCVCSEKETEAKDTTEVKSVPAGGGKEVTKVNSSEDEDKGSEEDAKKETEACDEKETESKDDKEECAKDDKGSEDDETDKKETEACDKEDECNYEAKFAQLSADYVAMQKENETLKAVNAKFEADIADLMAKVSKFEAEKNDAVNTNLFNFAKNMIEAETDLSEDCRKAMSAEVEIECKASKFSSEDEVKKFTVTKIAMALYEARQNSKGVNKNESKKEEFVQTIVAPGSVSKQAEEDALTAKRKALEALE